MSTEPTTTSNATPPRPGQAKVRAWALSHGIDIPPKGKISNAVWARWDEFYETETRTATTKLNAAVARAHKAFEAATAHVQKHFED